MLENVVMKQEYQKIISMHLGIEPVFINSSLVSAQNRKRLYWTNMPYFSLPNDKGVLLQDILESGVVDRDKSYCIDANYWKGTSLEQYLTKSRRQIVFTERRTEEAKKIRSEYMRLFGRDFSPRRAKELVPREDNKCNCLTTSLTKEHILLDEQNHFRKLTPIECERLQTVPDNYTSIVSNTQRYRMLGNGWTVDVIVHLLMNLPVAFRMAA
jgi:site-specific DNA-cytosine methylase